MSRNLSLVCWNVWFDRLKFNERCGEIFRICRELNPDVICLQEVTPHFLRLLQEDPLITSYVSSESAIGPTIDRYGVIILCRPDLAPHFTSYPYTDTEMERSLLLCNLTLGNTNISVGTTHLESLNSASYRRSQLLQCKDVFSRLTAPVILCGDFNFCSYRNYNLSSTPLENTIISEHFSSYSDLWAVLREDKGYTFDSTRNSNIKQHEVMRYDRIICDGKGVIRPVSIDMIGTAPIGGETTGDVFSTPPKQPQVFPSDHFGLYAKFDVM